ncbi:MAG TPA: MFS transporter, partial [Saprospiraceae bacterium]|nr:MFS transporter [Saprospiraceae bacterium]
GFFLAGIYPTGMKIAADYFEKEISKALGFLLGALVLGSAFPLLLRSGFLTMDWKMAIMITSLLALLGGIMVFLMIPNGPYRKAGTGFNFSIIFFIFKNALLRKSVFGYFGHMWELYAFWAFVPTGVWYVANHFNTGASSNHVMGLSFVIIAIGSIACIIGGYMALNYGSAKVAMFALISSGLCCLLSPWVLESKSQLVYYFLLFWGMTVIMDSPQFSSLVSKYAPVENRGAALTIVNCIGFSITIFSIQLLDFLSGVMEVRWIFLFLLPGPVFGVIALMGLKKED